MSFDYSSLLDDPGNDYFNSWEDIYAPDKSLPANFLDILRRSVCLPYNHYKIITAYAFIPSVLARVVPYLFLWGVSGSGKSTIGKLISYLHGVTITSSDDTFAAIRNSLSRRKRTLISVPSNSSAFPNGVHKEVEANTCMVWDDIDPSIFTGKSDVYRLFKFGYDKSCDVIEISSEVAGENIGFRCFCPKTFSSISPLHLNEDLKELRRRLIVVPTKRIEDLRLERQKELGISDDSWEENLIDISNLNWKGFSDKFKEYWTIDTAQLYLVNRKMLATSIKGLSSQQRAISIDLIATGMTIDIWSDKGEAIEDVKEYWKWFKGEIKVGEAPLTQLLTGLIAQEATNAKAAGIDLVVSNQQVKGCCDMWLGQGYLLDKPNSKAIQRAMNELGFRLVAGGKWVKS